jgi:hypothetical protein
MLQNIVTHLTVGAGHYCDPLHCWSVELLSRQWNFIYLFICFFVSFFLYALCNDVVCGSDCKK